MKTYPLLQSQIGVLLHDMQHPKSTHYNLPNYLFIPLSMTRERVVNTAQKLVDSFPELHTRFVIGEDGEVRQWSDLSMPIPVVSRKCTEAELQAYIDKGFVRPFDPLGSEPLFRVEVIETEKNIYLLFDAHHAIMDGMSFLSVVSNALVTIFEGGSVEPQPYGLYQAAEDEAATFGTEVYQRAKAYYAKKFAGLEMATLSHGLPGTMGQMGRCIATLDRHKCDDWCHEHGVQPNLLLQAAFGHVISVLTRQEKVAYSSVNHGRTDKRLRSGVGMFVRSVPMLADADPSQRVIDFVRSQRAELMSTIRYGAYPFTHFCSDLQMKPGVTFNFMGVANMEEYMVVDGVKIRAVQPVRKETDSDLSVDIYLKDDNYEIRVDSSLAMNDASTLQMVAETMKVAVNNMMAHPELTLGELDIVSADERLALVKLGAGKQLDIDPEMTFVKAFEQCASQHPNRLAVADAHDSLTYGELSHRSDALAQRLIDCGVRPNDFVAVMLDRTVDFPLVVIAIHKAGSAYVPIDLEYPEERRQYMLSDCQAKVVVDSQFMAETDFNQDVSPIDLSTADSLAYMIYTSGSTGEPKGAMIHQAALWNFIQAYTDVTALTADDRICGHNSFSFDGHVEDMFPILTLGGSYHIMSADIRLNLAAIRDFLFEHQITGGGFTTALATLLFAEYDDLPVRFITAGGEKLGRIFSNHVEIINTYGPTECTVETTYYPILPGRRVDNIPIGKTFANCHSFIVDAYGRLLPRGAVGELYTAGKQVGRGYWQQPELTAEKFTPCPFLPSSPSMYRTGDLCRWNAEGNLEYVGRTDDQVKLRGFRIELGEIESCAEKFEGISQAVAVIRPIGNTETLCLYYTADGDAVVDVDELRQFLSRTLAEYMVPAAFMQIDALPLTPNGKVDHQHLPAPTLQHANYVAPRNELENLIVSGFEKVLNQEKISVDDDFVHLGGDSFDALKLVFSLGKAGITVADVLSLRTPAAIASNAKSYAVNLDRYSIESGCPLNNTQMFIYQDIVKFNKYDSYLIPSFIPIDRKYTDEQIRNALDAMFTAHPVLTMHVAIRDGVPFMEKGDKPVVMKGSLNPLKILSLLTSGFDLYSCLSRYVISTEQYAEMDKYIRSMLGNLSENYFYRNPGKHGRPGYHKRELGVDCEQVNRFTDRFGINKNILFTAAMAMTLSRLAGSDDVAFGFLDNGRDRFNNFEDIGLYITGMPIVTHVDHHDMQAFLDNLSDVYYKLSQNNFFPFASLVQEFNIAPIILFQFFPDWIMEDGKYDDLPRNETLVNKLISMQKDFMVEALTDVVEMGNSYTFRIFYSGYYSRKMMKVLATTYKETITQMLKS